MTKLSFVLVVLLTSACAKNVSRTPASIHDSSSQQGVIGGKAVANNSLFERKVLKLALDVEMKKQKNGAVSVTWNSQCTASAISEKVLLTAAHCVDKLRPDQVYLVLTQSPEKSPLNLKEWIKAKEIRVHEKYQGKSTQFAYDVALILLEQDLEPDRVLKFATPDLISFPLDLVVIGYGTTSDLSKPDDNSPAIAGLHFVMKSVDVFHPEAHTFSINQNDHKGFCSGDSGGPGLIYDDQTKEFFILGVVSNTSMYDNERIKLDPQNQYSLCIGQGNYMNVLNSEIRAWIISGKTSLTN